MLLRITVDHRETQRGIISLLNWNVLLWLKLQNTSDTICWEGSLRYLQTIDRRMAFGTEEYWSIMAMGGHHTGVLFYYQIQGRT